MPPPTPLCGLDVGAVEDKPFNIPLVDRRKMEPQYARQVVEYKGSEKPGTVIVDIDQRFLYLVQGDEHSHTLRDRRRTSGLLLEGGCLCRSQECVAELEPHLEHGGIKPDLPRYASAGIDNPLGARALYLYQGGRDTLFRIHGTNEP